MERYLFKISIVFEDSSKIVFEDVIDFDDEERYLKLVRKNKAITYISHRQILSYNVELEIDKEEDK